MNAGEACKLLRDHTISEYFIIPDEVVHIIREVNCKIIYSQLLAILMTPQEECHYLTYQGLEQLLIQVAVHISRKYFYKRKKSKTLVEIIKRLFTRMGLVKEDKGMTFLTQI